MTKEIKTIENGLWTARSTTLSELLPALLKAQSSVQPVIKDSSNPFFKSKYADLATIWEAIRKPLADNDLVIIQEPSSNDGHLIMSTTILHVSGEYLRSQFSVPVPKQDPQGYGSATTYARRYALQSILGIAPEDDDGNAASHGAHKPKQQTAKVEAKPVDPDTLDHWYSFDSIKADAAKLKIARQVAQKCGAIKVEKADKQGEVFEMWACSKMIEPRKNFDQFLMEQ